MFNPAWELQDFLTLGFKLLSELFNVYPLHGYFLTLCRSKKLAADLDALFSALRIWSRPLVVPSLFRLTIHVLKGPLGLLSVAEIGVEKPKQKWHLAPHAGKQKNWNFRSDPLHLGPYSRASSIRQVVFQKDALEGLCCEHRESLASGCC